MGLPAFWRSRLAVAEIELASAKVPFSIERYALDHARVQVRTAAPLGSKGLTCSSVIKTMETAARLS
jgi:hypothetical protein